MQGNVTLCSKFSAAGKCHTRVSVILTRAFIDAGKCPMQGSDISYEKAGKCHAGKRQGGKCHAGIYHRAVCSGQAFPVQSNIGEQERWLMAWTGERSSLFGFFVRDEQYFRATFCHWHCSKVS